MQPDIIFPVFPLFNFAIFFIYCDYLEGANYRPNCMRFSLTYHRFRYQLYIVLSRSTKNPAGTAIFRKTETDPEQIPKVTQNL